MVRDRSLAALVLALALVGRAEAALAPACGQLPNQACVVNLSGQAGIDCTGATDMTSAVNTVLAANGGKTIAIPSGCILGLASPGAGNAALTIKNNTHLMCADQSAGFRALRQRCTGGTYPGAACTVDADCLGSGTCDNDFNGTNAAPCTASSCFAPTGGSIYTMLKDENAQSSDIFIENCTFWTGQADPYQHCSGGTNTTRPCRQECSTGSTYPGLRCEVDADCAGGGTCLNRADCNVGGGTCGGAPTSTTGAGKINPIDLTRTFNARIVNVSVDDHFTGDFGLACGEQCTIRDTNVARESFDCTTPFAAGSGAGLEPATSLCWTTFPGKCCYGAISLAPFAGTGANVQPAIAVTNGIVTGQNSQLIRTFGRGSTTGITGGNYTRLDECTLWPPTTFGPGKATAGYAVGTYGVVAKSQGMFLQTGTSGASIGANGSAIEDRFAFDTAATTGTGITLTGANAHAIGNNIQGLLGSMYGLDLQGDYDEARGNYVDGATTNAGIRSAGLSNTVAGNQLISNPVATMAYGVQLEGDRPIVSGNHFLQQLTAATWLKGTGGFMAYTDNNSILTGSQILSTLKPVHVLMDNAGSSQNRILGNAFYGGWRGIWSGTAAPSLYNTNIGNNRFVNVQGASIVVGGAGMNANGNYFNTASFQSLTCDPSCDAAKKGQLCGQDSDCTGGTGCTSTFTCQPEPIVWIGTPSATSGNVHPVLNGNLIYQSNSTKQCGGTGPTSPGARCTTAATACSGGTCTGGSEPYKTCVGGAEAGLLCCTGGGSQTCSNRSLTPSVRVAEYPGGVTYTDGMIVGNNFFVSLSTVPSVVQLDFVGSGTTNIGANISLKNWVIAANNFNGQGAASTTAIRLPTNFGTITDVNINGNNFGLLTNDVVNYKASMGEMSFVPISVSSSADTSVSANTAFTNVTGLQMPVLANRTYNIRCDFIWTTNQTTAGIGLALTGPSSPTRFAYVFRTSLSTTAAVNTEWTDYSVADDTIEPSTSAAATSANIPAKIEGVLVNGANAGNITARVRAEVAGPTVAVKAGSNCVIYQVPAGS